MQEYSGALEPARWKMGLMKMASLDFLNPSFSSPLRKTSFGVATFNLVATIVGGGVLSLPLAFAKAGIILATIMMVFSALITEFSMYLLCSSARRTGSSSFMEVVRHAFGAPAEILMTITLWLFLSGFMVGYYVLLMGIFSPIIKDILSSGYLNISIPTDGENFDATLLLFILLPLSPLMLQRNLYALRHICYVGFTSVCIIVLSMGVRAYQRNVGSKDDVMGVARTPQVEIKYFTSDLGDALFTFPIIVLSFLCIHNVVEVQGAIQAPTRPRVHMVLRTAVFASFMLFEAFALVGYFYAYSECKGNIFLNFDPSDPLIIVGRLGMGLTLMFAVPVVTLPCRDAFLSIFPQIRQWWNGPNELKNVPGEDTPISSQLGHTDHSYSSISSTDHDIEQSLGVETSVLQIEESNFLEELVHVGSTLFIASSAYFAAVAVPGIAFVWSIMGSSLGMLFGFIVPSACYLKIRARKGLMRRSNFGALCLLLFSVVLAIMCTIQAISGTGGSG